MLAASGLLMTSGAAANAAQDSDQGRESSTVQLNTAELTIERTSITNDDAAVAASDDVDLSFQRPVVSSKPAPEPSPEPEPEPEPESQPEPVAAEAAAAEQAEREAQAPAQTQRNAEAQREAEAQAQQEAEAQREAEAQAQQEAEAQREAEAQQNQQQAEQSQSQSTQSSESSAQQQDSGSDSGAFSNDGASPAGGTQDEPQSSGGGSGSVVAAAQSGIGSPYSYGGTTTSGFDCSGFINWAYAKAGAGDLPRTTHGMASSLSSVSSPQPGDIVLANGNSHGGIYIGNDQVISATTSGGVRVHSMHAGWHQVSAIVRPS